MAALVNGLHYSKPGILRDAFRRDLFMYDYKMGASGNVFRNI